MVWTEATEFARLLDAQLAERADSAAAAAAAAAAATAGAGDDERGDAGGAGTKRRRVRRGGDADDDDDDGAAGTGSDAADRRAKRLRAGGGSGGGGGSSGGGGGEAGGWRVYAGAAAGVGDGDGGDDDGGGADGGAGAGAGDDGDDDGDASDGSEGGDGGESSITRDVNASKGLAGTLALLVRSGAMAAKEKARGRNKDGTIDSTVVMGAPGLNDFVLEYRDADGRLLTAKQAYRELSYKFHGQRPSQKVRERAMRREAREERVALTASGALPMTTMTALEATQRATGAAHVTLARQ